MCCPRGAGTSWSVSCMRPHRALTCDSSEPMMTATVRGLPLAADWTYTQRVPATASAQPQRLGEEFVIGILVLDVLPHLGDLAVADVEHQDLSILKGPAPALARSQVQADGVLVVGHDVVQLRPECAGRQLHRPAEERKDRVDAAVVARQRTPAREVPDDSRVEQLTQGLHVALREGVVPPANKILVRVCHRCPLSSTERPQPTTLSPTDKTWLVGRRGQLTWSS